MALVARRAAVIVLCTWACTRASAAQSILDLNSASLAQLEALGGVGTALAARMIDERAQRPFADWADAQKRLKGLGPKLAAQLSDQGLTVNGAPYTPAPRE
jgi:competence protein ComEA